ncbi:MAG: MBL fold metallo-hydrolase [Deltaproteobacteria bacterium HGW-Deltaproteobacteria-13]|jgi:7,8-dihydropterin-6-yl-methyl-4-(beta-D-ribofuranosyl)aminobenzene 5'-phosphate synthase|nr:MAG: MBL fold metallo-hydrolase [Deltaproteobacteria bacterium HGW-Deltaproteobacteria-13]
MTSTILNVVDKVEILTLQDNYIDITAMDNNAVVTRAMPIKDGQIKVSIGAEHGFSAIVKTTTGDKTNTVLFDFGFSEDGAAQNAKTLGVDMTAIEAVVLSHGHSDHTGGMGKMTALIGKKNIPFVAHPSVFKSTRYLKFGEEFNIYFPKFTREMVQSAGLAIIEAEKPYPLLDNTVLFLGEIPRLTDFEKGFPIAHCQRDGQEVWDAIEDDTSIVMNLKNKGLVILSGCAHAGIVNTVSYAVDVTGIDQVHAVMGGFHLTGPFFEPIIDRTTQELQKFHPAYVVPTHCTGHKAIMTMEKQMPDKFILNMSGTKLTFT